MIYIRCLKPNMINGNGKFIPFNKKVFNYDRDSFLIPCNYCFNCKCRKSKSWALRCLFESFEHKYNYFLTLTYNDENLKFVSNNYHPNTGEFRTEPTLCKKDLQDFNKRLRRKFDYRNLGNYKYFAAGEYGDQTHRPHYHMLMFSDVPIQDLVYYKQNKDGDTLWTSEMLNDVWGNGYVVVGEFTPKTAAYTARYTLKKLYGDEKKLMCDKLTIEPEFMICSKKPPIGWNYFLKNKKQFLKADSIVYYDKHNINRNKIPLAYLRKLPDDEIKQLKDNRKKTAKLDLLNYMKVNNNFDYFDQLVKEEFLAFERQKKLKQTVF